MNNDAHLIGPAPRQWNPRFVHYAREAGRSPEAQLARDRGRWGGMTGFLCWIGERWAEFRAFTCPGDVRACRDLHDHQKAFDAWLANRAPTGDPWTP